VVFLHGRQALPCLRQTRCRQQGLFSAITSWFQDTRQGLLGQHLPSGMQLLILAACKSSSNLAEKHSETPCSCMQGCACMQGSLLPAPAAAVQCHCFNSVEAAAGQLGLPALSAQQQQQPQQPVSNTNS
jgi:hypothetical protein